MVLPEDEDSLLAEIASAEAYAEHWSPPNKEDRATIRNTPKLLRVPLDGPKVSRSGRVGTGSCRNCPGMRWSRTRGPELTSSYPATALPLVSSKELEIR